MSAILYAHFVIVFRWTHAFRLRSWRAVEALPPNRDIGQPGDVDRRQRSAL